MINDQTHTPDLNRMPILIMEDDPFIAMDLEDLFDAHGFDVIGPFADVQAGLEALKAHKPEFAVLDFDLGRETSLPIAKALRANDIPFVFLSGRITSVDLDISSNDNQAPAPAVIAKPFTPDHVIKVAKMAVGSEQKSGSSVD